MLVSTILCCHVVNDQLHTSIKSIINQTYNNHELIILFDNPDLNEFINLKIKLLNTNQK